MKCTLTWQKPVPDVGIFFVEYPPAAIVSFTDVVWCMLITFETGLPQTQTFKQSSLAFSDQPVACTKTNQQKDKVNDEKGKGYVVRGPASHGSAILMAILHELIYPCVAS